MNKLIAFTLVVGLSSVAACSSENPGGEQGLGPTAPAPGSEPETAQGPASNSGDPMAPPPQPGPGNAMVRCIHASADAPQVDVYVKGNPTPIVTGLTYGQTSGWLEVPAGSYDLELRAAPSKASDPIAYRTGPLSIEAGQMISGIAAGLIASADADDSFRVLVVAEKFDPVPTGKVRIRAVHAGADAPTIDLDVGNDNPSAPEVSGLARFADTGPAGVVLPANERLALGIAKDASRVTSFTTPKLEDGGQLLVIATGLLGETLTLLAIGPSGALGFIEQDPIVYALHAGPDAPRVEAFVGATEVVNDIGFGEISKPLQVAPGTYTLDFFATTEGSARPDGKAAATTSTGELAAGERYLAVATGFLSSFQLVGVRDGFVRENDKSVLRLVHAAPDAPAVDVGLVSGSMLSPVLFADAMFGESSDEAGIAATPGHLLTGVTPAGQKTSILRRFTVPATKGQRSFVVAAGALNPSKGSSFRLLVVETSASPWTVSTLFSH